MMWKIIFILLISTEVYSQSITFSKAIDFNAGLQFPVSIVELDSSYVMMGMGQNIPLTGGWIGCIFIKTDSNGNITLSNFYGKKTVNHFAGWIGSFIETPDDKYVVGVSEFDSVRNNFKAVLIRYNENGDTVFVKRYGGVADDLANQVIETPDKGFALFGKTTSFGVAFYLVKTDSIGNFEWQKTYVHSSDSRGLSIAHAHDGGYIMSGWGNTPGFDRDTYVVKADSAGNEQWKKRYGTKNDDGGSYINLSSDSTYIVYGIIDTFNLTTTTGQKLWSNSIMKIDLNGEIIWRYITNYNWYQQITMVREIAPGKGYVVVGGTYDAVYGAYNDYGWIFRMDNDGNILWERKYAYPRQIGNNGLAFSTLYDVQPTRDGGFICLGNTFNVNQDFWLLKLDSLGCMGNYCGLTDTNCYYQPYPDCDDTVGISEYSNQQAGVRIHPNPASETIHIALLNTQYLLQSIIMADMSGKQILQTTQTEIPVSHLSKGLYFVRVEFTNGQSAVRKVVIQ